MTNIFELNPRESIHNLIERHEWAELNRIAEGLSMPELADMLAGLEKVDQTALFRNISPSLSAGVFPYLPYESITTLLKGLTDKEIRVLLASIYPDDRTKLFEILPGQTIQRLLNLLAPDDRKQVNCLLGFPEESVGRLMTPDYVAVRPEWTITQALSHIRVYGKNSETINNIFVTNQDWQLLANIELRRLILADPSTSIEQIMDHKFVCLSPLDDREQAVRMIQRFDVFVLPVVDDAGVLLGIVTADDVFDVAQQEVTEDFQKSSAIAPLRASYGEAGIKELYLSRVVWLITLIFINLISSGIIAAYETTLASAISLAFFIPLLIDSGGNAGSQSATIMIRALATGEVRFSDWYRILLKELAVGAALGVTMGFGGLALGLFRGGIMMGLTVGISMIGIVVVSNLIGMALPFLLTRLKLDPAVASSPLITSIADSAGLLIYFSVAALLLRLPL